MRTVVDDANARDRLLREQFFFDPARLKALADSFHEAYAVAQPFPHVVIDDFLPAQVAEDLLAEFPDPADLAWRHIFADSKQVKLACDEETRMGPRTRHLIGQFNSASFLTFLEAVAGMEALVPDPHLAGGGLHQILPGGYLKIHADFNWYPRLRLDRRLNLLLYLNKDWREEYGGHLELWDAAMSGCRRRVLPAFNRCVIFSTTDFAYHGHPDPLTCPKDRTRKSVALYYYSNGRPEVERSPAHSTLFQERPAEQGADRSRLELIIWRNRLRTVARKLVPPIFADAAWLLRQAVGRARTRSARSSSGGAAPR